MDTFFNNLVTNPVAMFILLVVISHMTFLTVRSYFEYKTTRNNMLKLDQHLKESEQRVRNIMSQMDQNRDELMTNLSTLNDDLKADLDRLQESNDSQSTPES